MGFASHLKNCSLVFAVACLLTLSTGESVSADGCWGSSRGGWGSGGSVGGGSFGCRGGLLSNAPVRNLLAQVGYRVGTGLANLGDGVANVLERRPLRNALFGSHGGSNGGCNGGSSGWGCRGSFAGGSTGGWGNGGGGWGCTGSSLTAAPTLADPYISVPAYDSVPSFGFAESTPALVDVVPTPALVAPTNLLDLPIIATDGYGSAGSISAYLDSGPAYADLGSVDYLSSGTDYLNSGSLGVPVNQLETSAPVLDYGYYGSQFGSIGLPTDATMVDGSFITGPMMEIQGEPGGGTLDQTPGGIDLPGYDGLNSEPPSDAFGAEEDDDSAFLPRGKAILGLNVPVDAKVYINDRLTKTEGTRRQYVSRNLVFGQEYRYRVRVVSDVDGKEVEKSRVVRMRGGQSSQFAFNFEPVVTRVVLSVPDDAKVTIDGKETSTAGSFRSFSTQKLKSGKWDDYSVEVSVVRNGKTLTKRESFDLGAGEFRFFEFEFDKASPSSLARK